MSDASIGVLSAVLVVLIIFSAFFSASETGLMALNRYRLRHLVKLGHKQAMLASKLLEHPDRLIGFILLANNFANTLASSIFTVIALKFFGESGIAIAAGGMTIILLLFAEVTPKTLAAFHPERIAFPASLLLTPMLKIFYPLVYSINIIVKMMLRPLGVRTEQGSDQHELSTEELRTVLVEAGAILPTRHQHMLLSILDLEKITVDDVMVPRNEIGGLDLDQPWEEVRQAILTTTYTRLPVYRAHLENILGILPVRQALYRLVHGEMEREDIEALLEEPYFIPEGTPLNVQLLNFQHHKTKGGIVLNEYGEVAGLVTLGDILEEIVGEFTPESLWTKRSIYPEENGWFLVEGSIYIRDLNRALHWHLPTDGPKTLNGLVLEYLEAIPTAGTSIVVSDYLVEIVQVVGNAVRTARVCHASKNRKLKKG